MRTIQGKSTLLAWPMGIDVSRERNELAVANYGIEFDPDLLPDGER